MRYSYLELLIALGSNIGDRVGYIENALRALESHVCETSLLYKTKKAYGTATPDSFYLNCVVRLIVSKKDLSIFANKYFPDAQKYGHPTIDDANYASWVFLIHLLTLEVLNGRNEVREKFLDRTLDLDIIVVRKDGQEMLQGHFHYASEWIIPGDLILPHPLMDERRFVLQPLNNIASNLIINGVSVNTLLTTLEQRCAYLASDDGRIAPLQAVCALTNNVLLPIKPSHIPMFIVNLTPDSFSTTEEENVYIGNDRIDVEKVLKMIDDAFVRGAVICDIGAESTKPKSKGESDEVQLLRIVPVLRQLRDAEFFSHEKYVISVDTRSRFVFDECLKVFPYLMWNDVGSSPSKFYSRFESFTILKCHALGTPSNMSNLASEVWRYNDDYNFKLFTNIFNNLRESLILQKTPWRVIIDPGFGFGKVGNLSLQIFQEIDKVTTNFDEPICLGISRKRTYFQASLDPDLSTWHWIELLMKKKKINIPILHRVHSAEVVDKIRNFESHIEL